MLRSLGINVPREEAVTLYFDNEQEYHFDTDERAIMDVAGWCPDSTPVDRFMAGPIGLRLGYAAGMRRDHGDEAYL